MTYEDGLVAAPVQMGAVAAPAARLSTGQAATPPDSPREVAEFIMLTICNEWLESKFVTQSQGEFERIYWLNS